VAPCFFLRDARNATSNNIGILIRGKRLPRESSSLHTNQPVVDEVAVGAALARLASSLPRMEGFGSAIVKHIRTSYRATMLVDQVICPHLNTDPASVFLKILGESAGKEPLADAAALGLAAIGQCHRFGTASRTASIARRIAGDISCNFRAVFMAHELSCDTP
jgi:hypothetical protein